MSAPLARPARVRLEVLAASAGIHPAFLRRLVSLGLLDAESGERGELLFPTSAALRVARIQRLHTDLSLNYSAIGLVLDLLDRIDRLEAELRRSSMRIRGG
jgi:chaperone modulatory protein CbpM